MADTEANIKVRVEQADQSAAAMKRVAGGIQTVERAHEQMGGSFKKKFESTAIRELTTSIGGQLIPGFNSARGAVILLTSGMRALLASFGVLAGPVIAVGAALGALAVAWKVSADASRKMREETEKNYKAHSDLLRGYQDAERAGVKLTGASRDLYDSLKELVPEERAVVIETMKLRIAEEEARQATDKNSITWTGLKSALFGGKNMLRDTVLEMEKGTVTLLEMKAAVDAVALGFKDDTEAKRENLAATERMSAAWSKAAVARRTLETLRATGPREKARIEIDALNSEFIANDAKNRKIAKSDEEYQILRTALEQEYSDKRQMINEKAAQEMSNVWRDYLRVLEGPMTDLALRLPRAFREGSGQAKAIWKDFCNAVRDEAERLLAQKTVQGLLNWAAGGSGQASGGGGGKTAGTVSGASTGYQAGGVWGGIIGAVAGWFTSGEKKQFGGYVPGPEGRPRMIMAHGGEQVITAAATPISAPAGGGNVNHYHGAIYSERQLFRAQRRSIRSRGERGLS